VLKKLAKDAAYFLQNPVVDAVITVPAYFGENERAATEQAGKIAGLNVRSIINEPTAAAYCYGIDQMEEGTILVFDLGGGTFDVTMIDVKERNIDVICTGGDSELGGKNWDENLLNYFVSQWCEQTDHPDLDVEYMDAETVNDLRLLAEDTKQQLTAREKLTVSVQIEGERAKVELSRAKFDELTADLLERTIELTNKMLADAKEKGVTDFSKILLVGGSTRMPQIEERLKTDYGKETILFDPDEAVAKGAALFAQRLALKDEVDKEVSEQLDDSGDVSDEEREKLEEEAVKEVAERFALPTDKVKKSVNTVFTPVTSKAFGVVALDDDDKEVVVFLVGRNASLPVDEKMPFGTSTPDQRSAAIRVMEGENEQATALEQCNEIGQANLDLPEGLPKGSGIEITFRMNDQGMLEGTAKELTKGGTVDVSIDRGESVMSDEEVEERRTELQMLDVG